MKKIILLFSVALCLLSCNKEQALNPIKDATEPDQTPVEVVGTPITFDINIEETKAIKTGWVDGDIVYVFFKGLETKYLKLVRSGTKWNSSCPGGTITDSDLSGLAEKKLYAIYFPVAAEISYADNKFSFTSGGEPIYQFYNYCQGMSYTLSGTKVSASFSLNKAPGMIQFHIAGIEANVGDYTFACNGICPRACVNVDISAGTFSTQDLSYGARLYGVADSDGGIFAGYRESSSAIDYDFVVSSATNIYTLSRKSKSLSTGKMYNFPALSVTGGDNWSVQDVSTLYVDLGLSVKWAKSNLGASAPAAYDGGYYSWGEIRTKDNYGTSYYVWKPYTSPTKYNGTDGLATLQLEDDAAFAALGGNWRVPTSTKWNELINNCTWTWYADYNSTGIAGYLVTSNKSGYESNSIFLPAAGMNSATSPSGVGTTGYYWSATVYTSDHRYANYLTITSSENSLGAMSDRYYGYQIRPVCE